MEYWIRQRQTALWVNSWALPSLLDPESTTTAVAKKYLDCANSLKNDGYVHKNSAMSISQIEPSSALIDAAILGIDGTVDTASPCCESILGWHTFSLPLEFSKHLTNFYVNARRSKNSSSIGFVDSEERWISTVFNQNEVPTRYFPLLLRDLRRLEQIVLEETVKWVEATKQSRDVQDWKISSSYGIREYQKGAIIRWHADPEDTQPITAVIHIADSAKNSDPNYLEKFNVKPKPWPFEIIRPSCLLPEGSEDVERFFLGSGEAVIFESGRLAHGRSEPLEADWFGNVFVHLAPATWISQLEE
jgi:hypothetical protein